MTEVALPSGTVTFLFTDIEGSTRLLQELGADYRAVLSDHRALIERAVSERGGRTFGTEGDAVFVAFGDATPAVEAAADAQLALAGHRWPDGHSVQVRMGVHTGEVTLVGDDYVGLTLHQTARIAAAGHGGQVLVSNATAELVRRSLSEGRELRDLGEHRLKDLAGRERLFQLVAPGLGERFPSLRTLEGRPNNLPLQVTSFVGREELEAARSLLGGARLLTMTGPGGTGKTRLALQLAAETSDEFPDGVFFVALDAVREPDLVPSEIALALGLTVMTGEAPLRHVIDHVRDKRLLLVLDNFEQVVDGASVVAEVLREAPDLKVVVTSRIPLRISGEQEFPVPALGVPAEGVDGLEAVSRSEAARLFVERAMAAQPSFRMTDQNAPAVADIVRRLDGLPLAIELAASRVRIFPVDSLAARLDQRLAVLTGGPRDVPARQQTLRGAIDWSYDLLDDPDRHLFARFAVFSGGGYLPQVEAVCGPASEIGREVIEGVDSLVEKSLLRSDPRQAEEPRFAMLPTIQEYAIERLEAIGEAEEERRRHATSFLAVVEAADGQLTGADGPHWLDRLESDHDNIRIALDRAVEAGDVETALRFIAGIWRFWQIRGHLAEAAQRIKRVLDMPDIEEQPLQLQARAHGAAGSIGYWRGDYSVAHRQYKEAAEIARGVGDRRLLADSLYDFGFAPTEDGTLGEGRYQMGRPLLEEALGLYREIGDRAGVAKSTWAIAIAQFTIDDVAGGMRSLAESITANRELGDSFGLGWALHLRGIAQIAYGEFEKSKADLDEGLRIFMKASDQTGVMGMLLDYSMLAAARGDRALQWRLRGAVERLRRTTGMEVLFQEIPSISWTVPPKPDDDPETQRFWEEGEQLTTEGAIELALAPIARGRG